MIGIKEAFQNIKGVWVLSFNCHDSVTAQKKKKVLKTKKRADHTGQRRKK